MTKKQNLNLLMAEPEVPIIIEDQQELLFYYKFIAERCSDTIIKLKSRIAALEEELTTAASQN